MERIEQEFSILFSDEQSPYFQVDSTLRWAFPFQKLRGKPSAQKSFIKVLFTGHGQIDLTFLKSYANGASKHFRSFEKHSLHQVIHIQNWREDVIRKEDDTAHLSYVTMQNIAVREVLAYIKSIARGKRPAFIAFYNDRYLLMVDDEECVVISRIEEDLNAAKSMIQ